MSIFQEAVKFDNISVTTGPFVLTLGGPYNACVNATFGGGTVELQVLGEDGVTWCSLYFWFNNAGAEIDLIIGKFLVAGMKPFILAPGTYRWAITTATAVFASVVRAPY
jgi:hypothetical protein